MANELDDLGRAWVSWSDALWAELDQLAAQTFAEHAVMRSFLDVSSSDAHVVEIDGNACRTQIYAATPTEIVGGQLLPRRINVADDGKTKLRRHVIESAQLLAQKEDELIRDALMAGAKEIKAPLDLDLFVRAHQQSGINSALVLNPELRANLEREVAGTRLRTEVEAVFGGTIAKSSVLGRNEGLALPRQPPSGALVLSYGPRVRVTKREGDLISLCVELRSVQQAYAGHLVTKIVSTGSPPSTADVLQNGLEGLTKALAECCKKP